MTKFNLRPYQEQAITDIRQQYSTGQRRVLLHLATGGGKTVIFSRILEAVYKNNKRGLLVVKGRELVNNASNRLFREGIDHGVLMANSWNNKPNAKILVCSIDTLTRREIYPKADFIVIDECQDAGSKSYKKFLKQYQNAYILGVSATPHVKNGLQHVADVVVRPVTIKQLIDMGFLCPPKYFIPSKIDVSGVKIDSRTGDYVTGQLEKEMDKSAIYGDLVSNWKKKGENRKTIIFAVSIKHSKKITAHFNNSGIPCAHVDANTSAQDREKIIKDLEQGKILAISNVNVFGVGVDIPCLSCCIMARPTKSYNIFIQYLGRCTRIFPNKKDFLVFDHVGACFEHGFIEDEQECILEGWKGESKQIKQSILNCESCFIIFDPKINYQTYLKNLDGNEIELKKFINNKKEKLGDRCFRSKSLFLCPACEHDNTDYVERKRDAEEKEDKLKEISEEDRILIQQKNRLKELRKIRKAKGYKQGWVYHAFKVEFGEEVAAQFIKKRTVPAWVTKQLEGKKMEEEKTKTKTKKKKCGDCNGKLPPAEYAGDGNDWTSGQCICHDVREK